MPLVGQTIWNQVPVTLTASLNVIVRLVLPARSTAPLAGVVAVTLGAASVANEKTWSAAIVSGGSPASWSVTCAANTVTVHVSGAAKSAFGLIVNVVGPPATRVSLTLRVPLPLHTI